jgi:hypothetical protein
VLILGKYYAIVAFCAGAGVAAFSSLSEKEKEKLVVTQLGRMFKHPNALDDLLLYRDHDWTKEVNFVVLFFRNVFKRCFVRSFQRDATLAT